MSSTTRIPDGRTVCLGAEIQELVSAGIVVVQNVNVSPGDATGLERLRCLRCDYLRRESRWNVVVCLASPGGGVECAVDVNELLKVLRTGCL